MEANSEFMMIPGQWYKGATITYVIEQLYQKYCESQSKIPDIGFSIFTDGCIFIKQVLEDQLKDSQDKCRLQPNHLLPLPLPLPSCLDLIEQSSTDNLIEALEQLCDNC